MIVKNTRQKENGTEVAYDHCSWHHLDDPSGRTDRRRQMDHEYRRDPDIVAVVGTVNVQYGQIRLSEDQNRGPLVVLLSNPPGLGNDLAFRGL